MPDTRSCTYEDLYYEMWEMSQRYRQIAQFRIIGKSHDERMIPMIELGKGNSCIFLSFRGLPARTGRHRSFCSDDPGIYQSLGKRMEDRRNLRCQGGFR